MPTNSKKLLRFMEGSLFVDRASLDPKEHSYGFLLPLSFLFPLTIEVFIKEAHFCVCFPLDF